MLGNYGYSGLYLMWDPTYILIIIGVILSLIASAGVRSTFNRYKNVSSSSGLTGAEVAERILRHAGIQGIQIAMVSGNLSDHYNPKTGVVSLSQDVYGRSSIAAIAVAAHECGHVIQHDRAYGPLSVRTAMVPIVNFSSGASWFVILAGIFFSMQSLITLGIILFSAAVVFQLVTLPVEFNASKRAMNMLLDLGILSETEGKGARKVLNAAAMTYVAAAAASILQLLRLIILFGRKNND